MDTSVLSELNIRSVTVPNRFMMAPMCQYSCETRDGMATEWHHVHYGSRAVGKAGIVMTESAAVEPEGRISPYDLGIWTDDHARSLSRTAEFVRSRGSIPAIQLAHAGRKACTDRPRRGDGRPVSLDDGGWEVVAPTGHPWPYEDGTAPPTHRLTRSGIDSVVKSFREAAGRATRNGFEAVEIHAAHGYLLHQFLSPVTNQRQDEYGGSFENRTRFLREVVTAVRKEIGEKLPLFVRISATDWLPDEPSWDVDQSVRLAEQLASLDVDLIDVSAGGIRPDVDMVWAGPNYQVTYAERIRKETTADILVGAVGGIKTAQQAEALVRNERADLAIIGRKFLSDPYFPINAAKELGESEEIPPPAQLERGF